MEPDHWLKVSFSGFLLPTKLRLLYYELTVQGHSFRITNMAGLILFNFVLTLSKTFRQFPQTTPDVLLATYRSSSTETQAKNSNILKKSYTGAKESFLLIYMGAGQRMNIDAAPSDWPGWDQISGKLIGRMEKCPVNDPMGLSDYEI